MMTRLTPPAEDEIEVTLFGRDRGSGECCVLHVGENDWVIVDTFNHSETVLDLDTGRKTRMPVARWYLDRLGVKPERVRSLVVTHFHQDHYLGIRRLRERYVTAQLVVTRALQTDTFRRLFSDQADTAEVNEIKQEMDDALDSGLLQFWSVGNARTYGEQRSRMTALSPTEPAILASMQEIGALIEAGKDDEIRSRLGDPNVCSVALQFESEHACVLLCADLPRSPEDLGWRGVLDHPGHETPRRADLVKAPHHGGESADYPPFWERFVTSEPRPLVLVAPFSPSGLPSEADLTRLCDRGIVWQAAPSGWQQSDAFGYTSAPRRSTGFVQARRRPDDESWRIYREGPSFCVNPPL